ncbi:acyltransferase [Curtobacterium sp. Leaf261]|uniref:acyltransferase n=1 Tax=Curtobacterium sp. Leaf261 TaxID=1736311 RepID=UPI0006F8AF20|nr:acyltransferase [Curtobacterium sp. Leaf261]KQO62788.1 hypothetical protein ASF23_07535 [Curtobacterium sp. Leaf261]
MLPLSLPLAVAPLVRRAGPAAYRRFVAGVLRRRGAEVGEALWLSSRAYYDPGPDCLLTIEDGVVVSNDVRLLTHDFSMTNVARELSALAEDESLHMRSRIVLRRNAFVGMGAIVLPGVTIGRGSVVGAGSVVTKDVPDGVVVAGNPARAVTSIEEYHVRRRGEQVLERTATD